MKYISIILLISILFCKTHAQDDVKCDYMGYINTHPSKYVSFLTRATFLKQNPSSCYACYKLTNTGTQNARIVLLDILEYYINGEWIDEESMGNPTCGNIYIERVDSFILSPQQSLYFFLPANEHYITSLKSRLKIRLGYDSSTILSEEKRAALITDSLDSET